MNIYNIIRNEITSYTTKEQEITPSYMFSQYKLIKKLNLYANCIYPLGKFDKQGKFKYFSDIISPRVNSEIKNIDFDTKDIIFMAEKQDYALTLILNYKKDDYFKENNTAEFLNDSIEEFSAWGNVVFKKVGDEFEKVDLQNFYVINQTAKTLNETPVIEKHILSQSQLRSKEDVWNNIDKVIEDCGNKFFNNTISETNLTTPTEIPYYEIFERNGEISEADLYEAQGKQGGSKTRYVMAKIVCAGISKTGSLGYVLFAEKIKSMDDLYIEVHRTKYTGRWFRLGLLETLFDCQTRANEIGNQISRGLEWASKVIFQSPDKLIAQNILTDLKNGDVIRTSQISEVQVRMQGFDQLVADWNRNIQLANDLANSQEIVSGGNLPSGTPFRLGAIMNQNSNKLFNYIRQKLTSGFQKVLERWTLPMFLKDISVEEVIELTGDSEYLQIFYKLLVNTWYLKNILSFSPLTNEQVEMVKARKLEEITKDTRLQLQMNRELVNNAKKRIKVIISGENVNLEKDLVTISSFINLEQDPIRRTALIEMAMMKSGMNISTLPKTELPQPQATPEQGQPSMEEQKLTAGTPPMAPQLTPQTV